MSGLNRFYYPIKYKSRDEAVSLGVTCVFISHQKNDKIEAKKIAEYLIQADIDVYFDEYDTDLKIQLQNNNPKGVAQAICNGINNSSHMLVLISPNSLISTWVPFEIGFGYDKTDLGVLTLKGIPKGSLPEYARSAKIIRDIWDLNHYISTLSRKTNDFLIETKKLSHYSSSSNPLLTVMDSIISDKY
jgi:hypothetical protein